MNLTWSLLAMVALFGIADCADNSSEENVHLVRLNFPAVAEPFIVCIVVLIAALSKLGFHYANYLSSIIPESCLLIVVGTIFGAILKFTSAKVHLSDYFTPHQFFIYLLPPIILEAAYSLHDRVFFENIGSVLLYAVMGTVFNFVLIGGTLYGLATCGAMGLIKIELIETLVFSSFIVAVDPVAVLAIFQTVGVNNVLYLLVFGESLLNDGVTVVLYTVMQTYSRMENEITATQILLGIVKFLVVCFGGLSIGVLMGCLCAFITKYTYTVKVLEPLTIFSLAFVSYLVADMFELSGIISLIGCGLAQVQYSFANITRKSRTTVKYFSKVASTASEIVIFLFLGIALVSSDHMWHTGFVLWTNLLCFVYRFITVYFLTFLINKCDVYRVRQITLEEQFIMSYGGLRGAIAFALVATLHKDTIVLKQMFVTTTLSVVIFTVFIQGISIKPLVKLLHVRRMPEKTLTLFNEVNDHVLDHVMAGIEDAIGFHGKHYWKIIFVRINEKYLKKFLQRDPTSFDGELKNVFEKLALKDHYDHLYLSGVTRLPESIEHSCQLINAETYLAEVALDDDDEYMMRDGERYPKPIVGKYFSDMPTAQDLNRLLSNSNIDSRKLHSKHDRCLTNENYNSFSHQLHLKHRRQSRLVISKSLDRQSIRTVSLDDANNLLKCPENKVSVTKRISLPQGKDFENLQKTKNPKKPPFAALVEVSGHNGSSESSKARIISYENVAFVNETQDDPVPVKMTNTIVVKANEDGNAGKQDEDTTKPEDDGKQKKKNSVKQKGETAESSNEKGK